jgi:hypothetical protein
MEARNETAPRDAIDFLTDEHRRIDGLFVRFMQVGQGVDAGLKTGLVDQMIDELRTHATMEETTLYPSVREVIADGDTLVAEAIAEHADARHRLDQLESMSPQDPGFDAAVQSLIGDVRHHVNEEEAQLLPRLRQAVGDSWLLELGQELEAAKARILEAGGAVSATDGPSMLVLTREGPASIRAATSKRQKATTKKATARKATARKATAKATSAARRTRARVVYHVTPAPDGRWKVLKKGSTRASSTHDSKLDAVRRSKTLARALPLAQVVVHLANGKIQQEFTYGADPRRTRG